jgi:hypothetical protein
MTNSARTLSHSVARKREWAAMTPEQRAARVKAIGDGIRKAVRKRRAQLLGTCPRCGHRHPPDGMCLE